MANRTSGERIAEAERADPCCSSEDAAAGHCGCGCSPDACACGRFCAPGSAYGGSSCAECGVPIWGYADLDGVRRCSHCIYFERALDLSEAGERRRARARARARDWISDDEW